MILLDKPYVSEFLENTIKKNNYPVVKTSQLNSTLNNYKHELTTDSAVQMLKNTKNPVIYTNSENTIAWIAENLSFTNLPGKIDIFKNKIKFRNLIKEDYPDFFYKEVKINEIKNLDPSKFKFPFIIKPAAGFFSMGVYKVNDINHWNKIAENIEKDISKTADIYPLEVMNAESLIMEEYIEGDEYAVDVYFNDTGDPVVLGIFKHLFSGSDDVSDRVYIFSKNIIKENIDDFTTFMKTVGKKAELSNFPVHAEFKKDKNGRFIPVEINPMRFGGWCTTADMTWHSLGLNPYEYYLEGEKPDWDKFLKGKDNKIFSIIVLDNSTQVNASEIKDFDYKKLASGLENVLDLRKINYLEYPVFGFVFAESEKENFKEIENLLHSDLREFLI
jgi:hypothetical protein